MDASPIDYIMRNKLRFGQLDGSYSVCRLPGDTNLPDWVGRSAVSALLRSRDELSILVSSDVVPRGVEAQHGFAGFRIVGTLAFSEIGIISEVTDVLASMKVPVFVVSSFDTDYFFVPAELFRSAADALVARGHDFGDSIPA